MTDVVVGVDVGGTRTGIAVETVDGKPVVRVEIPSREWSAAPAAYAADWIARRVGEVLADCHRVVALGAGVQGCNTDEHGRQIATALAALRLPASVVNDAALLVPGAGLEHGIGVVCGTGAIAVGRDHQGRYLFAGGWGWVLGDDASAPGLVREATRAALFAHDAGQHDDGLLAALQDAFDTARPDLLARAVNDTPTQGSWGPKAPAVFAAADAGSALAARVIEAAAVGLATQVGMLVDRGAVGRDVVASGGVVTHQPRLYTHLQHALARSRPALTVHLLAGAPVDGAVATARRLLAAAG